MELEWRGKGSTSARVWAFRMYRRPLGDWSSPTSVTPTTGPGDKHEGSVGSRAKRLMNRHSRDPFRVEYDFSHGDKSRHHEAYQRGTSVTLLDPEAPERRLSRQVNTPERGSSPGGSGRNETCCHDQPDWASEREQPATKTDSG